MVVGHTVVRHYKVSELKDRIWSWKNSPKLLANETFLGFRYIYLKFQRAFVTVLSCDPGARYISYGARCSIGKVGGKQNLYILKVGGIKIKCCRCDVFTQCDKNLTYAKIIYTCRLHVHVHTCMCVVYNFNIAKQQRRALFNTPWSACLKFV